MFGKKFAIAVSFLVCAVAVMSQTKIMGPRDFPLQSAPSNPASGFIRLFANTSSGNLDCVTSAGASCISASGSGTVNSGAGKGSLWLFGFPGYTGTDSIKVATAANYGYLAQFLTQAQTEWRYMVIDRTTAGASGTTGLACGIWSNDQTSLVASTATVTGLNATGALLLQWTGGSAVAANVLTLPAGSYWMGCSSDDTTLTMTTYYVGGHFGQAFMGISTHVKTETSSAAISSNAGSSLALTGNISGVTKAAVDNLGAFYLIN